MLCEVESFTALLPQICQIFRVPRGNGQPIQLSEASTALYLCFNLIILFGLELHHL